MSREDCSRPTVFAGSGVPVSFTVDEGEAGTRLDRLLADRAGVARAALDVVAVTVDGRPAREKDRPRAGAHVEAEIVPLRTGRPEPADVAFGVVHADADIVVVDKPPGLTVHPAGRGSVRPTLVAGLLARFPDLAGAGGEEQRPGIVHRIDKDTSGLLVVARTEEARRVLSAEVAARSLHREYSVLTAGGFDVEQGLVDGPVGRAPGARTMSVRGDGRPARTAYRVEARWERPRVSALTAWLETGRTHQIRVHLASIGHPVVGDAAYGGPRALGSRRQFLHSHRLELTHPRSGERLVFVSPLPPDLRAVLTEAGPPATGRVPAAWLN